MLDPMFPDIFVRLEGHKNNGAYVASRVARALRIAGHTRMGKDFLIEMFDADYPVVLIRAMELVNLGEKPQKGVKMPGEEYVEVGPSPANEECAQLGVDEDFPRKNGAECREFIVAIRRKLGPEVGTARLGTKAMNHEFGVYREVVCRYQRSDREGLEYALRCEKDAPRTWAEVGMSPPC